MPGAMAGRVCIVTGANSGIGLETCRGLARQGATVVMACRSVERGEAAAREVQEDAKAAGGSVEVRALDLGSLASVRRFAHEVGRDHPRLHVLVNNAGIFAPRREVTADGMEATLMVNHLGHFLLTHLLLPHLLAAAPGARIVNVASEAHRGGRLDFDDLQGARRYSGFKAYMQSKLANIMFTYALARRLDGKGVAVNAVHPGSVATNWARQAGGPFSWLVKLSTPFMITAAKGADTVVWLAASPEVERVTGQYFARRRAIRSIAVSYDRTKQERLWDLSARMTGVDHAAADAAKAST